ncbi:MAG: hypothetical protein NTV51_06765 [Verrucomicrobia bacterium]|nr:hypothetical protein [Verrucomicrobiota bacterium]
MPTTRRRFLATLATITLAPRLRAAAEPEPVIVGEGAYRYRFNDRWAQLPAHLAWGLTHGVVVDRRRHVHVFHTSRKEAKSRDCVVVFDAAGRFVRSWGEQFFGGAHGFDLVVEDGREILYLTDLQKGLFKMTLDGELLWHVEKPEWYKSHPEVTAYRPSNVAVAPNGDVYFADGYGSYYIHHYTKDGRYVRTFGGPGEAAGRTQHPHGLFVDRRGPEPLLVVAENDPKGEKPGRLQAFSLDGEHRRFLPTPVRSPRHFDQLGKLAAIPDLDARVTLVDENYRTVANLGDGWTTKTEVRTLRTKPSDQFTPGKFVCPHDAAFDADGSLFIAEWVNYGRIVKLEKLAAE